MDKRALNKELYNKGILKGEKLDLDVLSKDFDIKSQPNDIFILSDAYERKAYKIASSDLNDNDIVKILLLKQIEKSESIRVMISFFVGLTIVSLIAGIIVVCNILN